MEMNENIKKVLTDDEISKVTGEQEIVTAMELFRFVKMDME